MPEGPSIVILKDAVAGFTDKKILRVVGNATIDKRRIRGRRIVAFRSWGKHFLIDLDGFALRIHFLMFGSYTINTRKDRQPRLRLQFAKGEINFYSCAIRFVEGDLSRTYDWSGDVLSNTWDARSARRKLRAMPEALVCDALLDQTVFAGVGNIIKNEVLFRIRVHPLSLIGALPARKLRELVDQSRQYSFDFLEWKRQFVLKKHWLAHTKRVCPRCHTLLSKAKLGVTNRRSFFCEACQLRYSHSGHHTRKRAVLKSKPRTRGA